MISLPLRETFHSGTIFLSEIEIFKFISMNKYFLHSKLTAKDGQAEKLTSLLLDAAKIVSPIPGCIMYVISKDKNDPDSTWVTEVWNSKQDHDQSLNNEQVKALISRAMPVLQGTPQKSQELEVLGGRGI